MPTFTKSQIATEITDRIGFTRKKSVDVIETLIETIKQSLESGEDVLISGFGKFCVKDKNERRGRNPATGGSMMLRPRRVVTFKCSGKLRDRLNGND
ncbi:MAG: integration host factor subunit alpha [Deltaproteobacteria bacterium]|nr:integration host factor subunit alpha [Deltaproteobacteria bacterium]